LTNVDHVKFENYLCGYANRCVSLNRKNSQGINYLHRR